MPPRETCLACLQPDFSCFCGWLKPFDPGILFVILVHPIEVKRRRIATGRLSHLSLAGSKLLMGHDFSGDARLGAVLADPGLHCVMLYPGPEALDLTARAESERLAAFPADKRLAVIVIDGTWATSRKMLRLSRNLHDLPRICFTPARPSNFRIREQPNARCYSTIEAIHQTLDLLAPKDRRHDTLLDVFDRMVDRQIELTRSRRAPPPAG